MSLLDPRQFFLSSFYQLDPTTAALLARIPTPSSGGGKMLGNSFRISDILSNEEKGNSSVDTGQLPFARLLFLTGHGISNFSLKWTGK